MARKALSFEEFQARFPNEAACADHKSRPASYSSSMSDLERLADGSQMSGHFRDVPLAEVLLLSGPITIPARGASRKYRRRQVSMLRTIALPNYCSAPLRSA